MCSAGWLEDEPARVTRRRELRPAGELGPIIVCLDTSGSMYGAREVVAKALVLECMRGAQSQRRKCYVYAFRSACHLHIFRAPHLAASVSLHFAGCVPRCFRARCLCAPLQRAALCCSGPRQVRALDLSDPDTALEKLLSFLEGSFNGGTDVDQPLELALQRLKGEEWNAADILMVTDGEIPRPRQSLLDDLKRCNEDLGLEVHGLLVGKNITEPMEELCTQLHQFKSWSVLGSSSGGAYGW